MHRIWWSLALAAALGAAVATSLRGADVAGWRARQAGRQVRAAIALLDADTGAYRRETQSAVRAAAVKVDEGRAPTAEGWFLLGFQYFRERNAAGAEAQYRRAIAARPDWAWPRAALGMLLMRGPATQHAEALAEIDRAIALRPDWHYPYDLRAQLLRGQRRLEEAREAAGKALELNPDALSTQNNYANLLMALGEYEAAEPHYRRAIALGPGHAKPYYNLACLCSRTGRPGEALELLSAAIARQDSLRASAASDPDFEPLRSSPEFRRLVFGNASQEP